MRARRYLLSLPAVILLLGLTAYGCSDQETVSSATTGSSPTVDSASTTEESAAYVTVDVQTTYESLNSNEDAQVVDVREPSEWAATGVPRGQCSSPWEK